MKCPLIIFSFLHFRNFKLTNLIWINKFINAGNSSNKHSKNLIYIYLSQFKTNQKSSIVCNQINGRTLLIGMTRHTARIKIELNIITGIV